MYNMHVLMNPCWLVRLWIYGNGNTNKKLGQIKRNILGTYNLHQFQGSRRETTKSHKFLKDTRLPINDYMFTYSPVRSTVGYGYKNNFKPRMLK